MDPMDDIQPPTRKCISPTSVHFQDSLSNKSDQLLKSKVQGNRLTGLSHQFNTDFLCDEKRNDRDLLRNWNDREQLSNTTPNTNCMTTIQHLMSEHCCGSISNRSIQPEENTAQEKYLTRLPGYNNTDQLCDRESRPTDLQESWPHKELLYNRPVLINQGYKVTPTTHKEVCKVLISIYVRFLSISSQVVHKYILRDFGECCESVPLDCPGSYISISIKIYITIILACVVQVDAFYCESLSCYIYVVIVVVCCTSCVELEYLVFLTYF